MHPLKFFHLVILLLSVSPLCAQPGAVLVDYTVDIAIGNGLLKTNLSRLIRVDQKESNWIGDIAIYHRPSEKYKLTEAVILDSRMQVVRKIKASDIHTEHAGSDISFFDDRLVDRFSAVHNEYPYYIRYSCTSVEKEFLQIAYWLPRIYSNNVPTLKATLTLSRPVDYEIHMNVTGQYDYEKSVSDGYITESWSIGLPHQVEAEAYAPPVTEDLDKIAIMPASFHYGAAGHSDSWQSFGRWIADLNAGLDELPESEKILVKQRFGHLTDRRELTRQLYYYLQDNTRYISVSIDIGGLKPYPASYVSQNKYGDCKALTIYMKALLKVFDIDSYYTLVESGDIPHVFNRDFPAPQFNHVILCVPTAEDTLWLENTATHLPFGYLGTFTQNRPVLLVRDSDSQIMTTPALTAPEVLTTSLYALSLTGEQLTGQLNRKAQGQDFETLAYLQKHWSEKDRKDYLNRYFHHRKATLMEYGIHQEDRNAPEISLHASLDYPYAFRTIGQMKVVSLPGITNLPDKEAFKKRTRPIRFMAPLASRDSLIISPESAIAEKLTLPEDTVIESAFGTYSCRVLQVADQILITKFLFLHSGNYPAEKGSELYAFLKLIETYEANSPLIIRQ